MQRGPLVLAMDRMGALVPIQPVDCGWKARSGHAGFGDRSFHLLRLGGHRGPARLRMLLPKFRRPSTSWSCEGVPLTGTLFARMLPSAALRTRLPLAA